MSNVSDEIKTIQTKLGRHITMVIPMIEEMTNAKLEPLCLIGFEVKNKKTVVGRFITISDSFDETVLEICKQLVKSKEPPTPVTGESEAIGFAEWATKEYTTVKFHGEFRWCTYEVSDFGSAKDSDYMTTAELYNLYKQSKK